MNFLKQILSSLTLHGLSFTVRLIRFKLLGGEDPRTSPEFINRMHAHMEPAYFRDSIRPYYAAADTLSDDEVRQLRRALLPIDGMVDFPRSTKRVNVVLDSGSPEALDNASTFLALAASYAKQQSCDLRIISRCDVTNPAIFYKKMTALGVDLPESIDFYSDMNRTYYGFCSFKLPVTKDDIFMVNSWYSAIALEKTTVCPAMFYYVDSAILSASEEQLRLSFGAIGEHTYGLVPSHDIWQRLNRICPHFVQGALCLEGTATEEICAYMEKCI